MFCSWATCRLAEIQGDDDRRFVATALQNLRQTIERNRLIGGVFAEVNAQLTDLEITQNPRTVANVSILAGELRDAISSKHLASISTTEKAKARDSCMPSKRKAANRLFNLNAHMVVYIGSFEILVLETANANRQDTQFCSEQLHG